MLILYMIVETDDLDPKLEIDMAIRGKYGLNTEICSNFCEIWHSQQMEHANHEYNTLQCLEHPRNYWLRMIIKMVIGCKNRLTVRT